MEPPKAQRKRARKAPAVLDRATAYATAVVDGSTVAGPHVRAACARHLRDLVDGPARGLRWDVQAAADAIGFFEDVLCLNGGEYEGLPFILDGWQAFIVGSLYGWMITLPNKAGQPEEFRRYQVAYIETGKGSGKSPLAAGIGLKGLCADGEYRAEVYAAATKKDQAQILFRDAVAMWQQSPGLQAHIKASGTGENVWNLAYLRTGSWFRPISADQGQSGPRPHVYLVDELHEHKTGEVLEMGRAGFKHRRNPLLVAITNSGSGKTSPCAMYHAMACEIAAGARVNDRFFSFVCGLDEGDDPFADESCWPKANPSLQHRGLPGLEYLRGQVREAQGLPAKEAIVRRLNFCEWTEAHNPWLSAAVWDPCQRTFTPDDLRGRRAYGGLDLSSTRDLTAFVLLVEPLEDGEPWHLLAWCWLPEQGLRERAERDRVEYIGWRNAGFLETTPGAAVDKLHVAMRVMQLCQGFDVVNIAYDRWRIEDLRQQAATAGLDLPPLQPFGQGFKDMSPALDAFETAVLNQRVVHNGHPILTWCAANAVVNTDPAGNRKLDKIKATGRIDLMVATVMAYGSAQAAAQDRPVDITAFLDNPIII